MRAIGTYAGISHTQARIILVNYGFKYQKYKRQLKLNEENMKSRLKFVKKRKNSDWGFVFFSDECSFWHVNTKPDKLWVNYLLNEQGTGTKCIKINIWGAISARRTLSIVFFKNTV